MRGAEWAVFTKKLLNEPPFNLKEDTFIYKIHFDRENDDLRDLILMQLDHPEFIKEVCLPFDIKIYRLEQSFSACGLRNPLIEEDSHLPILFNFFN